MRRVRSWWSSLPCVAVNTCLCVAFTTPRSAAAEPHAWPRWGGPHGDFKVEAKGLAEKWPDGGPRRLWSRPLGPGYSAIVAGSGRLYTMYRDGDRDVVIALNAADGKTIWEHGYTAKPLKGQRLDFGTGPNATPLLLGDRLIAAGFTGVLKCLSTETGKPLWSHDLVAEFGGKVQEFGYSASPLPYKGNVIVLVGGDRSGVMALDPADGRVVWKSAPHDISYASPQVINVDGEDQLVFMSSTEVIGLNASDGRLLWKHPCVNRYKNNATDPLWGTDNLLWVATQLDGGTRVLRLTRSGDKTSVEQVWFKRNVKIFHWNAIREGDHVYASIGSDVTMLSAIDVKTGEVKWRHRGFHKAQCLYTGDRLIFLDENGTLAMARVSPEKITMLSKVPLTEKVSWTVPALVGNTLYVRDTKTIMALDLR